MLHSEAYYVNDGAFYIGQTPPQDKPVQSIVRNVDGWGSPIGFSATNMRYVTITKSRFYNNGARHRPERARLGEVPAARGQRDRRQRHLLEQLQLPRGHRRSTSQRPATSAWCRSAPASCSSAAAATGSRTTGSTATTSAAWRHRRHPAREAPAGASRSTATSSRATRSGRRHRHNGHDIIYDGSGSDNCFTVAPTTSTLLDRTRSARAAGKNAFSQTTRNTMLGWTGANAVNGWAKHRAPGQEGLQAAGGVQP